MAFVHGKNTDVFYDEFDFSQYFDEAMVPMTADTAETTAFGANSKAYIAGLKDSTMTLNGFFEGSADAVDEKFEGILGGDDNLFSVYPEGAASGNYGYGLKVIETAYGIVSTVDGAVRISMAAQSQSGGAERLLSLHDLGAEADSNWTGTAYDNTASSANGGSAYLHVTAATGTTEIKIEHSSDNFVGDTTDLASFTAVAGAATSERITFAGTVKQYVRGYATVAGGESVTFQLGVYRA